VNSNRTAIIIPRLAPIQIHPIKSLDPVEVHAATIGSAGCLQFDRAWAVCSLDGRTGEGKVPFRFTCAVTRASGYNPKRLSFAAIDKPSPRKYASENE
jgi:uncharacterized protein YcbX